MSLKTWVERTAEHVGIAGPLKSLLWTLAPNGSAERHPLIWRLVHGKPYGDGGVYRLLDKLEYWRPYRKLSNAWYWLRCHTVTRYHILDVRDENWPSREGPYRWGWHDRCELLEVAMFAMFRDFVERELLPSRVHSGFDAGYLDDEPGSCDCEERRGAKFGDDDICCGSRAWWLAKREMRELYRWWTVDRPLAVTAIGEEAFERTCDEMLVRLVRVRHYLWT